MSERSNVELTFLASQKQQVVDFLHHCGEFIEDELQNTDGTIEYHFTEVKYGELNVTKRLQFAGIPYNVHNEAGNDYSAETKYCRYNEQGQCVVTTIGDSDNHIDLEELLTRLDSLESLREYILECDHARTPPTWDNQEEYAARYRAVQALLPKQTSYD